MLGGGAGGGTILCDSSVSINWLVLTQKSRVTFIIQSISPVTLRESGRGRVQLAQNLGITMAFIF